MQGSDDALPAAEIRRRHGLKLTSPARTLRDLASTSADELERAFNEALVLNLVTHEQDRTFADRTPALRAIVEESRGMTRSRMERALRGLIKHAGLPARQTNVTVAGVRVGPAQGRRPPTRG